jgi:hypothetical protein
MLRPRTKHGFVLRYRGTLRQLSAKIFSILLLAKGPLFFNTSLRVTKRMFTKHVKERPMTESVEVLEPTAVQEEPVLAEIVEQVAAEETLTDEPVITDPPADNDQRRRDWVQRIRGEQRLPGALRERLAAVVEEAARIENDAEPQLTISQVANVFAEAIPALLTLEAPRSIATHPAGEAFFHAGQLSDNDAARIASEQLARTGFGKS